MCYTYNYMHFRGSAMPRPKGVWPRCTQNFLDPPTFAQRVWHTATKFDMVKHMGEWRVSWGQWCPHPKGWGPNLPKFLWPPMFALMVWPTAMKFDMVMHRGVMFLGRRSSSHPEGEDPASYKFWGLPTCTYTVWETTTKFCMIIKLYMRQIVTWSTVSADARSFCSS